jgi:hypothetical protein
VIFHPSLASGSTDATGKLCVDPALCFTLLHTLAHSHLLTHTAWMAFVDSTAHDSAGARQRKAPLPERWRFSKKRQLSVVSGISAGGTESSDSSSSSDDEEIQFENAVIRVGEEYQCTGILPFSGLQMPPQSDCVADGRAGHVVWDPTRIAAPELRSYLAKLRNSDTKDAGEEEYLIDPWPRELGPKAQVEEQDKDPCGILKRGVIPSEHPSIKPLPAYPLRMDSGLHHLAECNYDVEQAGLGLKGLIKSSREMDSEKADNLNLIIEGIKTYGKDFAKVCSAINDVGEAEAVRLGSRYDPVTVAHITEFYYAKWRHTSDCEQWRRSAQYRQSKQQVHRRNGISASRLVSGKESDSESQNESESDEEQQKDKGDTFSAGEIVACPGCLKNMKAPVRAQALRCANCRAEIYPSHRKSGRSGRLRNNSRNRANSQKSQNSRKKHSERTKNAAHVDHDGHLPTPIKAVGDLPALDFGTVEMRVPTETSCSERLVLAWLRENDRDEGYTESEICDGLMATVGVEDKQHVQHMRRGLGTAAYGNTYRRMITRIGNTYRYRHRYPAEHPREVCVVMLGIVEQIELDKPVLLPTLSDEDLPVRLQCICVCCPPAYPPARLSAGMST